MSNGETIDRSDISYEQSKAILCQFTKEDIIANLWRNPVEKLNKIKREKKSYIINQTLQILTERFSDLDDMILYLHLRYIICTKRQRKWDILRIKNAKRFKKYDLTAEKVSSSIRKYFNKYNTECKVLCEKEGLCLWIVLVLEGNTSDPIYCIVHIKFSVVFVWNLKPDFSLLAVKVLRKTFRGSDTEQFTHFQSNSKYISRLTIKSWSSLSKKIAAEDGKKKASDNLKRKASDNLAKNNKVLNNSLQNNKACLLSKRFKETEVEECNKTSEPVIENAHYEVYSSGLCKKEKILPSYTVINIRGTNILKGLDKLIECNIADAPLPDYLYEELRCGKRKITLR